ncbi:MAG: tetratricopeptide repeat protein [Anaerolineae bacterium]|nr:tetratricopeptide repeat protein [Anaerolineae bacterium]
MNAESHRPALDKAAVAQALDALRTGKTLRSHHPLRFFLGVQSRLASPHVLQGDVAVQVAIYDHLVEHITSRLGQLRSLYRLSPPDSNQPGQNLEDDFRQSNPELEAWSVLYHRYVCFDQALSMQALALRANQDGRTLRRRQKLGVSRLTAELVSLEQNTRRCNLAARLRLALPSTHSPVLVGIDSLLETSVHILTEADPPRHLVLHGPPGIGKTAIAQVLAHALIEQEAPADRLHDTLWLEGSELSLKPAALLPEIVSRLGLPPTPGKTPEQILRAYLYTHKVLIVLDDAETLTADPANTGVLLKALATALLIMNSRVAVPGGIWCYQLVVPELSREDVFDVLDREAQQKSLRRSDLPERFDAIWEVAGGNPQAITLLLATSLHLPPADISRITSAEIDRLYDRTWEQLSPDARRVWLMPLFYSHGGIPYDQIQPLIGLSQAAVGQALSTLTGMALLMTDHGSDTLSYGLQTVARTFLMERVCADVSIDSAESARDFVHKVLERRIDYLADNSDAALALRALKIASDLALSYADRWRYARVLASQITGAGLWQAWAEQLAILLGEVHSPSQDAWLNLMLGVALRWTGRLAEARKYLGQALEYYEDDSAKRAEVLAELSVVCRYQGRWEEASHILEDALSMFTQVQDTKGIERCVYELGQLALESRESVGSLAWLGRLQNWSARAWGIASQSYLLLDQYDDALQAAETASSMLPALHPNQGRVAATLGQICDALGETDIAVEHMLLAIDLLDQAKDTIGYARVCNNLAAVYMKQYPYGCGVSPQRIFRLLTQALCIQEQVGDRIGLAVTRRNLDWLAEATGTDAVNTDDES